MFFSILKKDLQRRKITNLILLVFILLASMFISSSVNNTVAVLGGIDSFCEKANMPDLLATHLQVSEVESVLSRMDSVDSYDAVPGVVLTPSQLTCRGEVVENSGPYMIPFVEQKLIFFDENNAPITQVAPGTVRVAASSMRKAGLKTGDILELEINGELKKLTVAGPIKDASCLDRRYLLNAQEYEEWFRDFVEIPTAIFYIYTNDRADVIEQLTLAFPSLMLYEKEALRLNFLPDMILTGILLAVSICLILIAFVVLRFTISFTIQEEFRQIGVMKAIGLSNPGIRRLYLVKYLFLSAVGAFIGFFGSIPFSQLLLDSVSETMVLGNDSNVLTNALCCIAVVVIALLFCYSCTAKVKKFTPVDAIRNGSTGERFRRKGLLRLSKVPGRPPVFMAANDILSHPRRFLTIILALFLCLSLVLILTTSINTLKHDGLVASFNMTPFDLICSGGYDITFTPEGNRQIRADLEEAEALLKGSGLDCRCYTEVALSLSLIHGDKNSTFYVSQGIGTTADQYTYFEGSAPSRPGELAVTTQVANELNARIGDTVTMQIGEESRQFLITGYFQAMMNLGKYVRVHQDEPISYEYLTSTFGMQIEFSDAPDEQELEHRRSQVMEVLGVDVVQTASEYVEYATGMAGTLEYIRVLVLVISLIITALITALIGHSFIAKERGDIAILKAIGFTNSQLVAWHSLRFVFLCILAAVFALALHMPLMKLAIDPIFAAMGASFGIRYTVRPLEVYFIYPGIFLAVTSVTAFLTAQHTRTVQTNECSNID